MEPTQGAPPTSRKGAGDRPRSRARRSRGGRRYPSPRHRLAVASAAVLGTGLGVVSLLNALVSQGAFQEQELEVALIQLQEQEEHLARALRAQEDLVTVEQRARDLGMAPAGAPLFLDLGTGRIRGEPVPAAAPSGAARPRPSDQGAPGLRLADGLDRADAGDAGSRVTPPARPPGSPAPEPVGGAVQQRSPAPATTPPPAGRRGPTADTVPAPPGAFHRGAAR